MHTLFSGVQLFDHPLPSSLTFNLIVCVHHIQTSDVYIINKLKINRDQIHLYILRSFI